MIKLGRAIKSFFTHNEIFLIALVLFGISTLSFAYFYTNNQLLLNGDSLSRLNISRKLVDNLTPGFAQLGNVWLPLPQILMLPFVMNDFLWHSGVAGSIVSMISYIVCGVYLYKCAKVITNSSLASILALSVFAFNTNILYYQVTAMSETIFLCSIAAVTYYFLMWVKSNRKINYLILGAIAVSCATLIRYEALAILAVSILFVFMYSLLKDPYKKAEGSTVLYITLACLGFGLWTFYLTAIFGDPLYWKNYYAASKPLEGVTQIQAFTQNISYFQAFIKYTTAVVWMNGLIPVILSVISLPFLAYNLFRAKSFYLIPVLFSVAMFVFMILTLQRNTPISQPSLSIANILNPNTFKYPEFNIRYGLLMLPMITLLCAYLFKIRFLAVKIFLFLILSIQFYSYIKPGYAVIFQIPINVTGNITQGTLKEKKMMEWMKQNYKDDGLIMISALKHDPQMLQMGVDYKTYIHEGAGRYWKESTKDPQRYATWLILDSYNKDDQVTKFLKDSPALDLYYNRVYDNDGMWIYKIKTKPDIIL